MSNNAWHSKVCPSVQKCCLPTQSNWQQPVNLCLEKAKQSQNVLVFGWEITPLPKLQAAMGSLGGGDVQRRQQYITSTLIVKQLQYSKYYHSDINLRFWTKNYSSILVLSNKNALTNCHRKHYRALQVEDIIWTLEKFHHSDRIQYKASFAGPWVPVDPSITFSST